PRPAVSPHPDPLPASGEREPVESSLAPLAGRGTEGEGAPEPPAPPTMDDAAQLPPGADIRRFLAPQVDEDVKRAAFKKLFADPHFNAMDGLDTYIDDYGKPDPIPASMLRQLAQA